MKRYLDQLIGISALGLLLLASCKKDEAKVYFSNGTAPVLKSSVADSIPLHAADSTSVAVTYNWTNPNYYFSTGISPMNVTYYLQFDTVGANFTNPHLQTVSINSALSTSLTVAQVDNIAENGLLLKDSVPHNLQVRLMSFLSPLSSGSAPAAPLYSSAFAYTVVPYVPPPAVTPPPNDSLYIVGAAVAADNWANPMPPGAISTETFTRISHTEYKITIALTAAGEYKFISSNGSWSNQWSVSSPDTYPNGGPFISQGGNCIAPAAAGTYIIDVNFQTGHFTVTPQ
jgi:starch-binding outer membrane protein SusE/F